MLVRYLLMTLVLGQLHLTYRFDGFLPIF